MRQNHPVVYIPAALLVQTGDLLASFAVDRPAEGVVYWFGLEFQGSAIVTTLVVPDADTSAGHVRTSAAANAEALGTVVGTPLVLLGQAHSHPRANVRHSVVDDRETFAQFPGALSVVVPFFGRQGVEFLQCGVHRHLRGKYELIRPAEVDQHLQVLPGIVDLRRVAPDLALAPIQSSSSALQPRTGSTSTAAFVREGDLDDH